MSRPTQIIIDQAALIHNLKRARQLAPNSKVLAMVKAGAYGHGLLTVVDALIDADAFGLDDVDTALRLHRHGVRNRILLMEGVFDEYEMLAASEHKLDVVIHHQAQLEILKAHSLARPINVWIKINSGMNRLGFPLADVADVYELLSHHHNVNKIILMTHFADADDKNKESTILQFERFEQATHGLRAARSLANSAALIAWSDTHYDWVRPGIMLYGVSPILGTTAQEYDLKPAMSLRSTIVAIQHCKAGDAIGYGGRYICQEDKTIGIIPVGYGDGYPRTVADNTPVWVDGKIVPLVGNVSMDRLTVDLSQHSSARIGSPVECWGPNCPIEIVATHAKTIPYELMCRITARPQYLVSR